MWDVPVSSRLSWTYVPAAAAGVGMETAGSGRGPGVGSWSCSDGPCGPGSPPSGSAGTPAQSGGTAAPPAGPARSTCHTNRRWTQGQSWNCPQVSAPPTSQTVGSPVSQRLGCPRNSLCQFVGAGHGDQRTRWCPAAALLIGPRCDGQRPLSSVHLHPQLTVEPPAGTWTTRTIRKSVQQKRFIFSGFFLLCLNEKLLTFTVTQLIKLSNWYKLGR